MQYYYCRLYEIVQYILYFELARPNPFAHINIISSAVVVPKRRYKNTTTEIHHDGSRTSFENFIRHALSYTEITRFRSRYITIHYGTGFGKSVWTLLRRRDTGYCLVYRRRFRCPIYISRSRYIIISYNIGR